MDRHWCAYALNLDASIHWFCLPILKYLTLPSSFSLNRCIWAVYHAILRFFPTISVVAEKGIPFRYASIASSMFSVFAIVTLYGYCTISYTSGLNISFCFYNYRELQVSLRLKGRIVVTMLKSW